MPPDCNVEQDGIIAGCSRNQEWLLPWWWMNLRLHDMHSVTFVNFGDMSENALKWCQARGDVVTLDLPHSFVRDKESVDPELASIWMTIHSEVWEMRQAWFKKPFALLQSPYKRTLWLDLDCQVRGSLQPLFEQCDNGPTGIAMKKEEAGFIELDFKRGLLLQGEQVYNSGVVAFKQGADIIKEWAQQAVSENHLFMGDQQLLARILFLKAIPIAVLPNTYNWRIDLGPNPDALILHWLGHYKNQLRLDIELLKQRFLIDLSMD